MSALSKEQFYQPICPNCGSDFGDWDRTEEPNQVWNCFDCGTIKFKTIKNLSLRPTVTKEET